MSTFVHVSVCVDMFVIPFCLRSLCFHCFSLLPENWVVRTLVTFPMTRAEREVLPLSLSSYPNMCQLPYCHLSAFCCLIWEGRLTLRLPRSQYGRSFSLHSLSVPPSLPPSFPLPPPSPPFPLPHPSPPSLPPPPSLSLTAVLHNA